MSEPDETAWNAHEEPEEPAVGSWSAVDLDPYLSGQFKSVEPTVLRRDDGREHERVHGLSAHDHGTTTSV